MVVVTGPSGVGKDTVVRALLADRSDAEHSVSVTTREPREGERDGVDYHFVDRAAFQRMAEEGRLLEWAEYAGHLYGTPAEPVREAVAQGRVVILDIEVEGALQVREREPRALLLFLAPPDLDELERRLRERDTEDEMAVSRRLEAAREELDRRDHFDAVVVNDDLEACVAEVGAHIDAARRDPAPK